MHHNKPCAHCWGIHCGPPPPPTHRPATTGPPLGGVHHPSPGPRREGAARPQRDGGEREGRKGRGSITPTSDTQGRRFFSVKPFFAAWEYCFQSPVAVPDPSSRDEEARFIPRDKEHSAKGRLTLVQLLLARKPAPHSGLQTDNDG